MLKTVYTALQNIDRNTIIVNSFAVKRYLLLVLTLIIICSGFFFNFAEAGQKKPSKKIQKVQHHKPPAKRKKKVKPPIAAVPPVLDTTCLDTMGTIQRSLTTEINRWSRVRYKYGGMSPKGIDCSGFTYKVFQKALSYKLPRTSREQAKIGEEVEKGDLEFGDLIFFYSKARSKRKRINHVGIYIGEGNFVHSRRRLGVRIDSLEKSYYARHFAMAKRVEPLTAPTSEEVE